LWASSLADAAIKTDAGCCRVFRISKLRNETTHRLRGDWVLLILQVISTHAFPDHSLLYPHVSLIEGPNLAFMAMNDSSSTASASSSTTLRPRNRRRTNEEDEEGSGALATKPKWLDGPSTSYSSRATSPIPSTQPSRSAKTVRDPQTLRSSSRFLGVPGILGSQNTSSSFATSLWGSSWSSLQDIASTLIGNDSSRNASPDRSPQRRRRPIHANHGRDTKGPPAQWGPPGAGDKQLGVGTKEDRIAKVQAKKREALLEANGHATPDISGRYKRRDSDDADAASVSPSGKEDRDALVYLHKVKLEDTLAGVMIKYNCNPNIFRKANRLWPNDSIQVRKTVVLPIDACSVKGRKILESDNSSDYLGDGFAGEIMPTPTTLQAPWGALHDAPVDKETPLSSIPTSPSISISLSNPEEPPWKHDSWVKIDGFTDAVEIARLSRRTLGYFPRSRRKSLTFSDVQTPPASLDLPRGDYQLNPPHAQKTKSRSSSGSFLHGPGGVGTMGRNVRSPGPAQDGLNKLFAKHLPDVAPRSSFESINSDSSHGNGIENIGGAVEGWVRKLATKAAHTVQSGAPRGKSGVGDLIELSEDAFEVGHDEREDEGRRNTITNANAGSGVGAWSAEQERILQERFPPRGRVVAESPRRGKSS